MVRKNGAGARSELLTPLLTERLRLEPIRPDHADALFAGLRDRSLYTYETEVPPANLRSLRERYRALQSGRAPSGGQHWLNWTLVLREGGAAVGYVQATVDDDLARALIGYLVLTSHQRQGFATESVGAVTRHLSANGVKAIHAFIDVRNAASIALVERLGFRRIRTERSDDIIGGVRGFDHEYVLSKLDT